MTTILSAKIIGSRERGKKWGKKMLNTLKNSPTDVKHNEQY